MHWFRAGIQQRMTVPDAGDADIAGLDWFIRAINLHHAGAVKNYVEFLVILVKMFADNVALTSILKYWTYGDKPGEVREIVPKSFENTTLPPYSINIVE